MLMTTTCGLRNSAIIIVSTSPRALSLTSSVTRGPTRSRLVSRSGVTSAGYLLGGVVTTAYNMPAQR